MSLSRQAPNDFVVEIMAKGTAGGYWSHMGEATREQHRRKARAALSALHNARLAVYESGLVELAVAAALEEDVSELGGPA